MDSKTKMAIKSHDSAVEDLRVSKKLVDGDILTTGEQETYVRLAKEFGTPVDPEALRRQMDAKALFPELLLKLQISRLEYRITLLTLEKVTALAMGGKIDDCFAWSLGLKDGAPDP